MKIGINARFLRKPGTGIGEVTREFLFELSRLHEAETHEIILYVEPGTKLPFRHPLTWTFREIDSWYQRDDLVKEHVFETYLLPQAVRRDRCDVFFSLYQSATILPKEIRHIMMVHDLVPLSFPEYQRNIRQKLHYRAVLKGIRGATALLSPSHATAIEIEEKLEIPTASITVSHLGLPSRFMTRPSDDEIQEVLTSLGLESGYIYHGGGLEIRKNTTRLLEAYATLRHKYDALPKLVISGKIHSRGNPLATDVREAVQALGIEDAVVLLGFVPDEKLPALYAGALFFVYPSLAEGFGLPVLEALAMGTPVLTSKSSSLPEVAAMVARYCDPTHSSSIEHGMRDLLENTGLRQSLKEAGPEQAQKFSWTKFTQDAWKLLIQ